jgi:hypothetical protein
VLRGIHISVVLIHPLGIFEVGDVLLQLVHGLVDIFSFCLCWHAVFLAEMIF